MSNDCSERRGSRVRPEAATGPVVMQEQKGIQLVALDRIDASGKVTSIKPVYVFDVTQTQERTARAAA